MSEASQNEVSEVWVVCPDYGHEGLGEPVAAFLVEGEAIEYGKHLSASHNSHRIMRAPIMTFRSAALPLPAGRRALAEENQR